MIGPEEGMSSSTRHAGRDRVKKTRDLFCKKYKIFRLANFNPVATLGMLLLIISSGLGIAAVAVDEWSSHTVKRGTDTSRIDSSTTKTQGVGSRCISYVLNNEVLSLDLPSHQLPRNECISLQDIECSTVQLILESGHDNASINELQSTNSIEDCKAVKRESLKCYALVWSGVATTLLSVILLCPFWHRAVFVIGALTSLIGTIFYGLALFYYTAIDQDYAGFFTLNGNPHNGCWDISLGLVIGSSLLNMFAAIVAALSFCYHHLARWRRSKINH